MTRFLFSTGTARGGTNLVAKMLNVSPEASLASDPFLPLFKSFRGAVLKVRLGLEVEPEAPLSDHYYAEGGPAALRALYDSDLALPFSPSARPALLESLAKRMKLSSENLIPLLPELQGADYRALFLKGLELVAQAHGKRPRWTGFNDNWAIEFFPALARAFPEAQFLVMVRDPRAAICSALRQQDPSRIAPVLSFSRGWRKNVAYLERFREDPLFAGRLAVHTYEELVREPRAVLESLGRRLDLEVTPGMLDPRNFRDGAGKPWKPNSHVHAAPPSGIFQDSIAAWRSQMAPAAVEAVELVCGPEMLSYGYALERYRGGPLSPEAARFLLENDKAPASWKGSAAGVEQELRSELSRRQLLACPPETVSPEAVDSNFLFRAAYERCLRGAGLVAA